MKHLAGLICLVSLPAIAANSHCNKQEQTVFSCSLGKKVVSVCVKRYFAD
jgi:hypothetical protein